MPWDGVRRIIWAKNFDEMEIIGNRHFSIGVPIKADPEFKAMLFAAAITHADGNKSIDYIYRRYGAEYLEAFDDDVRCPPGGMNDLVLDIGETAESFSKHLSISKFVSKPTSGTVQAANLLIRMRSTFHAINQLVLNGLALEAEAVIRQGFEQCAWAHAVIELDDLLQIENTSPTKSVSSLKSSLPGAGRIYKILSDSAHASPASQARFIEIEPERTIVSIRSNERAREALLFLVALLDTYVSIATSLLTKMRSPEKSYEAPLKPYLYDTLNRYKNLFTQEEMALYASWSGA